MAFTATEWAFLEMGREARARDLATREVELSEFQSSRAREATRGLELRGAAGSSNSYGAKRLAGGPSEPEAA